jgi:hypothetical protein
VGRFQGLPHDGGQVLADRVQVDRVFQPAGERHHGLVRVIQPDHQDHDQAKHLRRGERSAVRPPGADHVAEGVYADVMAGHGGDRRGKTAADARAPATA